MDGQTTRDLERLLKEDLLGQLGQKLEAVHKQWEARVEPYKHVSKAHHRLGEDKELLAKVHEVGGFQTEKGIIKSAEILGISVEDLKAYLALGKDCNDAMKVAVDIEQLKQEWIHLLKTAPLHEWTIYSFPKQIVEPFIVLYITDWCVPCQLLKPTFARLSHYFRKASLYYSFDDALMKQEDVGFIPQFVAYFPDGGKVYSSSSENTKEVWDIMHKLITLGQGFKGRGRLECNGEEFRISSLD